MTDLIKNEIITIDTYPFIKNTIDALAKARGLTASEFSEQLLEKGLDELWQRAVKQ